MAPMPPSSRPTPDAATLGELEWVRRLARRLVQDPALADDVAQDAWLAAREHPPTVPASGLRAWLATVVQNRVRRLRRADRRRAARELEAHSRREACADPADVVARADLHREVTTAVMQLDEPYRSALLWRFLDELPATEVARRQGIGHDAARKRISRGMQLLRARLDHLHPGGFVAWSAAWTKALSAPAPASTASLPLLMTLMMNKWLLTGGAVAVAVWFALVRPILLPTDAPAEPERSATAAANGGGQPDTAPNAIADRRTAAPDAARIAVQVVDAGGAALEGTHVLPLRDGELPEQTTASTTDAAGRATFAVRTAGDEWLLARPGAVPLRQARHDGTDEQRIVWPAGHEVAGEVRTSDGSAIASLHLEHDAPAFAGLGPRALAALEAIGLRADAFDVPVRGDGRFSCSGLAPDWTGALSGPDGYGLRRRAGAGAVEHDRTLLLLAPARDLSIELSAPLRVRGRVRCGDAPVPGLQVGCNVLGEPVGAAPTIVTTDDDGRFELGVRRVRSPGDSDGGDVAALLFVTIDGGELARVSVRVPAGVDDHDVGELELGRPLAVQVLDAESQAPIAGAIVHVGGAAGSGVGGAEVVTGGLQTNTDADGIARWPATPPQAEALRLSAPGYRAERRAVPAQRLCTVELSPTNELRIRTRAVDGRASVGGLLLRVTAERSPLRGADPGQPFRLTLPFDGSGEARLDDLEPGVLLQLAAIDDLGEVVGEREVTTPAPRRQQTVDVQTSLPSFTVPVVVSDQDGRAIPRARLHVERDGFAWTGRTDATGRCAIGPLHAAVRGARVEVAHPAFVTFVRDDVAFGPETDALPIVLERGRRVEVLALQRSGAPLPDGILLADLDGAGGLAKRIEPGRYVFDNLAQRTGRVYVDLGGREHEVALDAQQTFVELRVPDLGAVTVRLGDGAERPGARLCVAVTALASEQQSAQGPARTDRSYFRPADGDARTVWLVPGRYRIQLERRVLGRRGVDVLGERTLDIGGGTTVEIALP